MLLRLFSLSLKKKKKKKMKRNKSQTIINYRPSIFFPNLYHHPLTTTSPKYSQNKIQKKRKRERKKQKKILHFTRFTQLPFLSLSLCRAT